MLTKKVHYFLFFITLVRGAKCQNGRKDACLKQNVLNSQLSWLLVLFTGMALGSRGGWPGQSFYLASMDLNPSSAICMLCGLGPKTYLSMPQFPITKGVWNKNFTGGREVQWVTSSLWSAWAVPGEVEVVRWVRWVSCRALETPAAQKASFHSCFTQPRTLFKPLSFLSPSEESSGLDASILLTPSSILSQVFGSPPPGPPSSCFC